MVFVRGGDPMILTTPCDAVSNRNVHELWGRCSEGLRQSLDANGQGSPDSDILRPRLDLVFGGAGDYGRTSLFIFGGYV